MFTTQEIELFGLAVYFISFFIGFAVCFVSFFIGFFIGKYFKR